MTALQTAQKRHANARAVLDLRLERGEDTTEARDQLRRAETELADAQAREGERQAETAARLEDEARTLADGMAGEIQARLAGILGPLQNPGAPTLDLDMALRLVRARQTHAEAERVRMDLSGRLDALRARLDALRGDFDAIGQRRAEGNMEDSDEARAHLLATDIEGVSQLVETLNTELGPLVQAEQEAAEALSVAEVQWGRAVTGARHAVLQNVAESLELALSTVAGDIGKLSTTRMTRKWMPTTSAFRRALENAMWGQGISR